MSRSSVDLPAMPTPPENLGSIHWARWQNDVETWVRVCRKIIDKNPHVQPAPMPDSDDFGEGSFHEQCYQYALNAWERVWD